jgi:hypothetical protein
MILLLLLLLQLVAAGCSCAPQWKNVVFDISPNGR